MVVMLGLGARFEAAADTTSVAIEYSVTDDVLRLTVNPNSSYYYILERTEDLQSFTNVSMALGYQGLVQEFEIPLEPEQAFFRVRAIGIFDPLDTDGDGIDDRYELEHSPLLNPFVATDAATPSAEQPNLSNYQAYLRDLFGPNAPQFYGREESIFNFGQPSARVEAVSLEISVYNANPGSGPPATDLGQVYSREASVWNYGSPSAPVEAISKEVSVYNANPGSGVPSTDLAQVYSRETSVFNYGSPSARIEAISAETSVFNFGLPSARIEAISRETSVMNFEEPSNP